MADIAVWDIPRVLRAGDTYDGFALALADENGAIPLEGAAVRMQWRAFRKRGALALDLQLGAGIEVSDALGGEIFVGPITVPAAPGQYFYDIEFTFADGTVRTWLEGTADVGEQVTQ